MSSCMLSSLVFYIVCQGSSANEAHKVGSGAICELDQKNDQTDTANHNQ